MPATLALGLLLAAQTGGVTVDRGDYLIHCGSVGRGRPVVAIPGGPGFDGRAVWAIGFGLRDSCRTYLFDQLGTGKSQMKAGKSASLDPFRTVEDLEAVRKAQGHKKWTVIGQSWGAIVAMIYAARHPQAVDHLILASIPGIGHDGTVLSANLAARIPKPLEDQLIKLQMDQSLTEEELIAQQVMLSSPYYFHQPSLGQDLLMKAPQGLFSPRVFMGLRRHILNDSAYRNDLAKLKSIKIPVTLIQGHQDPCGSAMPFLLKESFLPHAKVQMIDRCGHFPWMEQPDLFFSILHSAMKLKEPAWLSESVQFDSAAVEKENRLRIENGWPFGPTRS